MYKCPVCFSQIASHPRDHFVTMTPDQERHAARMRELNRLIAADTEREHERQRRGIVRTRSEAARARAADKPVVIERDWRKRRAAYLRGKDV